MTFNWYAPCAYDAAQKRAFHAAARSSLRRLAAALGFPKGSFDLRSNAGGIAVSGEVTLHHEQVYIQVADGLALRHALVMGAHRVEISGFSDGAVDRLKALGLTSEIIAWRLRLFVPVSPDRGPAIFAELLARHPLVRVAAAANVAA